MIQSPTSQYPQGIAPQAQPPVQLAPQAAPQTSQAPQAAPTTNYYTYPQSNLYQYPQASCGSYASPVKYSGVDINIYNPQACPGSAQSAPMPYMPAQFVPVPQAAAPVAQPAQAPVPPAPAINDAPPAAPAPAATETPAAPQAQAAPSSAPVAPQPAAQSTPAAPAADPQAKPTGVDVPAFNARLRSDNLEDQASAIEQIAEMTQNDPTSATGLLDTQIMEGLLGVIAKDTTSLQGPSPKQLEIRQKIIGGQQVSDAEKTEANTITPMETAERNKQYALYTVAFLQNLLNDEITKKTGAPLDVKDLPGMEQVVQTAKSDQNPILRASALASLSHVARPEYKPVLGQIFDLAKSDSDENVKEAAQKASEQLAKVPDMKTDANAQTPATPAAPADAPKADAPQAQPAPTEAPKAEDKKEEKKA